MRQTKRVLVLFLSLVMVMPAAHGQSWLNQLQNLQLPQIPHFNLPPGIPNPFQQLPDQAKEAALRAAYEAVGKALGDELPVKLDDHTVFSSVAPPAGFRPAPIQCTPSNANMPLPPGDYTCQVMAYCMMDSVHRPSYGVPYALAPLQGKQAAAIGALMNRGAAAGVSSGTLQAISWSIQAAIPLRQMQPQYHEIVHRLIPEYERGLQGDFLEQVEAPYDRLAAATHLPSFDSQLGNMGQAGRTILDIRRSRQIIRQTGLNYQRLDQRLYNGPAGQEVIHPDHPQLSPWTQIRPGVIAQFVVEQGTVGLNRLNLRVLAGTRHTGWNWQEQDSDPGSSANALVQTAAFAPAGAITSVGEVVGISIDPLIAATALIAYAFIGAQALMIGPPSNVLGSETPPPLMATQEDRPPPGSKPIDQTPWSGDHGKIKAEIGAGPRDNVRISPDGHVWAENPNGTWTDYGPASDYTESGKAGGRRGKDR